MPEPNDPDRKPISRAGSSDQCDQTVPISEPTLKESLEIQKLARDNKLWWVQPAQAFFVVLFSGGTLFNSIYTTQLTRIQIEANLQQSTATLRNLEDELRQFKHSYDRLTLENRELREKFQGFSTNPASNAEKPSVHKSPEIASQTPRGRNATPPQLPNSYNMLPEDAKRAAQVQSVLDHLEAVNRVATDFVKWERETKMAINRNIV